MPTAKTATPTRSENEIREIVLAYFYSRYHAGTSLKGKNGSAIKISVVKKEIGEEHHLKSVEIQRGISYLVSQGWVDTIEDKKEVRGAKGTLIPSVSTYYHITAAGIDKIEGPGEFTMNKFAGININATGNNIVTIGDGNQVNAEFGSAAQALSDLKQAVVASAAPESEKLEVAADIETIQAQLAKAQPNKGIIKVAWESVKSAAVVNGFLSLVEKAGPLLG